MRVIVVKRFKDRSNGLTTRLKGDAIEVTSERFEELVNHKQGPFVEEIKSSAKSKAKVDKVEETVVESVNMDDELEAMTKADLTDLAKEQGIEFGSKMTKSDMLKELI